MALDKRTGVASRNAGLNAQGALLNNGYIRIYSGTRPADPSVAIGAQVLLAELRFNATAFAAAAAGSMSANAITDDSAANATGTATWARYLASDGSTAHHDVEVGTSGSNINLSTVSIVANAIISISALTLTQPQQGA